MALAVDRAGILENLGRSDLMAATSLTPPALTRAWGGRDESPWFPAEGDLAEARAELDRAAAVKRRITLLHVDAPGNRDVALALRTAWRRLGIETTIRARRPGEYLDFAGPLSRDSVDVYQLDLEYPYPDALAGLFPWRCSDARNKTNFCHAGFDELVEDAQAELDPESRAALARRAEELLFGPNGRNPGVVLFWRAFPNLEALRVARSFRVEPRGLVELWGVDAG